MSSPLSTNVFIIWLNDCENVSVLVILFYHQKCLMHTWAFIQFKRKLIVWYKQFWPDNWLYCYLDLSVLNKCCILKFHAVKEFIRFRWQQSFHYIRKNWNAFQNFFIAGKHCLMYSTLDCLIYPVVNVFSFWKLTVWWWKRLL